MLTTHTTTTGAVPKTSFQRELAPRFSFIERILAALLLVVLLLPAALAIGVTPVNSNVVFVSDSTVQGHFTVLNNEGLTGTLHVSTEGELASMVVPDQTDIPLTLAPIPVSYHVVFPQALPDPGDYVVKIYVQPLSGRSGSDIGAVVRLAHKLYIKVNPAGSHVRVSLDVGESQTSVLANATVKNDGTLTIISPTIAFEISDEGAVVATAQAAAHAINIGESQLYQAEFDKAGVLPGQYDVAVDVAYGDKSASASRTFTYGVPMVQVTQATEVVQTDEYSPLNLEVTSNWNQELHSVYADIIAFQGNTQVRKMTTETVDIPARSSKVLVPVFDGRGIAPTNLTLQVQLHVGLVTQEQQLPLEVAPKEDYARLAAIAEGVQQPSSQAKHNWPTIIAFIALFLALDVVAYVAWRIMRDWK